MNPKRFPFNFNYLCITLLFIANLPACNTALRNTNTERDTSSPKDTSMEALAIVGTNDIHGNLAPIQMKTHDSSVSVNYEVGGVANISATIEILRSEFGEHLIWLDAGDEFQGTLESNEALGVPMVQFFNAARLQAAAIGNHEFDFGLNVLQARTSEARYPYLAANITDITTHQPARFPNTYPSYLFTAGHLKVGVIGLSTLDTPVTTRASHVKTLHFDDLKTATLKEAAELRKKGANIIVVTAHVGLTCSSDRGTVSYQMRKPSDFNSENKIECNQDDEMVRLLESLPAGTVDAVVSGHSHTIIHHWIGGVPVIQGGSYGRYLNVIYLTYDWSQKKVIPDQTRIEGPVPVCTQVFQNQNDCNGDRPPPKAGRGPLIRPHFHGKDVIPSESINALIQPIIKAAENEKTKKVGFAQTPLQHLTSQESPLGNLIADSIRKTAQTDFALVNSGSIRAPIEEGPISFGAVFRTMPFNNAISILHVTGKELIDLLKVAESGSRDLASVSGLTLKLIELSAEAPYEDLSGKGLFESWEANRLLDVKKSDGTAIDLNKMYSLATLDFLVTGGDDMKWPMSKIPPDRIQIDSGTLVRDSLVHTIQISGPLNSEEQPLVEPKHPRITFGKFKGTKNSRLKFHHRKKRRRVKR